MRTINKIMRLGAVLLGISSSIVMPTSARADEYDYFFEITCKPELGYFSLHTIQIDESFCHARLKSGTYCSKEDKAKHPDDHLHDPEAWLNEPYMCRLGDYKLTVHVTDRSVPWKEGLGGCPTRRNYDVELKINGLSIHNFHAYGQGPGQCDTPETHLIELFDDQLRDCTIPEFSSDAPKCETLNLVSEKLKVLKEEAKKAAR